MKKECCGDCASSIIDIRAIVVFEAAPTMSEHQMCEFEDYLSRKLPKDVISIVMPSDTTYVACQKLYGKEI